MAQLRPDVSAGRGRALAVLCTVLFLTFLDNTVVSVVLAGVQSDLGAGVQALQWVVNGYMLAFAALMLAGGTLGDLLGRKKVMLAGVAVFSAGSAVAMLAGSSTMLVAGRVVMGIGAAASEPGTLSIIRQLYSGGRERARALGIWAAVSGVALAFGPIIGGILVGFSSWRQVFTFSLVLGVLALLAGAAAIPESADRQNRQLDLPGLLLGALALTAATIAIIAGESAGYRAWWILGLFALSLLAGAAFVAAEQRARDPMLQLGLFRLPAYAGANLLAFATNFGVFAIFFFTALYLSIIAGFSGYKIALAFLAMAVAMVAASLFTGRWMGERHPAAPAVAGCVLAGGGMFAVEAVLGPQVNLALLAGMLGVVGLGFGMALVTMTSLALTIVPAHRSGMAAGTLNTSRELGGVFGVAVLGALVNGQLSSQLMHQLQALGLPSDFQSLVVYAITHGGNLPAGAHVSAGAILNHPQLVGQVTDAAYRAFGRGLTIALYVAGTLLLATALVSLATLRRHRQRGSAIPASGI